MNGRRDLLRSSFGVALSGVLLAGPALAQAPKLTRVIVGFPPGGGTDVGARSLVERLQMAYPGGIIVENKPGAGGRLAVEFVKAAAADGSTMLFTTDFPITI